MKLLQQFKIFRKFKKLIKDSMHKDTYYVSFMQHQMERPILQFEDLQDLKSLITAPNLKAMIIFNVTLDFVYSITNNNGYLSISKVSLKEVEEDFAKALFAGIGQAE